MTDITRGGVLLIIRKYKLIVVSITLVILFFLFPVIRFKVPYSVVIEANDGYLLGAKIAADGQWRFPPADTLPEKFRKCIIKYEDRNFYFHPGINPISVIRAIGQNIRAGSIISGASTLSMQVVRLSRSGKRRTIWEKLVEMVLTLRLESATSKSKILSGEQIELEY